MQPDSWAGTPARRARRTRAAAVCAAVLLAAFAAADTVVLRNGKTMEGVIESESADAIVLNIGMGSVTLKRSGIAEIVRSEDDANRSMQSDWETRFIRVGDLPEDLRTLARHLDRLRVRRETGLQAARGLPGTLRQTERLQQQWARQRADFQRVSRELADMDQRRDVRAYNAKVNENNQLVADVTETDGRIKASEEDAQRLRGQVAAYSRELALFESAFEPVHRAFAEQPDGGGRIPAAWLERTRAEVQQFQADFQRMAIPVSTRRGQSTLVDVSINGREPVPLILDTGASLVTLSETLARRLGVRVDRGRTIPLQLADGSRIQGVAVELEQVVVGEAAVDRVPAVVIDQSPGDNAEGLLGMSFLMHFQIQFDAANSQLELRRIRPR